MSKAAAPVAVLPEDVRVPWRGVHEPSADNSGPRQAAKVFDSGTPIVKSAKEAGPREDSVAVCLKGRDTAAGAAIAAPKWCRQDVSVGPSTRSNSSSSRVAVIGHKDASLTMRLYAHSQDEALKAAGASLDRGDNLVTGRVYAVMVATTLQHK